MTMLQTHPRPPAHRRANAPTTITVTVEVPGDDPRLARRLVAALGALARDGGRVTVAPGPPPEAAPAPIGPAATEDASVVIDAASREVRVSGRAVELTRLEFDLLCFLARYPAMVHTRTELLRYVWDTSDAGISSRTVDVHVRRVRAKLGEFDRLLTTVRGVGYRFTRGPETAVLTDRGAAPALSREPSLNM